MPQYDIEIRNTNVASDLSDCVIVLDFAKASADCQAWLYANAKSDGTDIRVYLSDGVTQLNHDLISFSKPGTDQVSGYMRILIPNVDSSANTPLRLDCDGARSDGSTTATYPSSWRGYWPLDGDANDRTSNGTHGTVNGAVSGSGAIGEALDFDGANDYVDLNSSASPLLPATGDWTISGVFVADSVAAQPVVFSQYINFSENGRLLVRVRSSTVELFLGNTSSHPSVFLAGPTVTAGQTVWFVAKRSGATFRLMANGGAYSTRTDSSATRSLLQTGSLLGSAGGLNAPSYNVGLFDFFNGRIDDIKVEHSYRSDAYDAFSYNNEMSSDNEIDYIGEVVAGTAKPWLYRRGSKMIGGGIL